MTVRNMYTYCMQMIPLHIYILYADDTATYKKLYADDTVTYMDCMQMIQICYKAVTCCMNAKQGNSTSLG